MTVFFLPIAPSPRLALTCLDLKLRETAAYHEEVAGQTYIYELEQARCGPSPSLFHPPWAGHQLTYNPGRIWPTRSCSRLCPLQPQAPSCITDRLGGGRTLSLGLLCRRLGYLCKQVSDRWLLIAILICIP